MTENLQSINHDCFTQYVAYTGVETVKKETKISQQECIPVGCVLPASMAIFTGDGGCPGGCVQGCTPPESETDRPPLDPEPSVNRMTDRQVSFVGGNYQEGQKERQQLILRVCTQYAKAKGHIALEIGAKPILNGIHLHVRCGSMCTDCRLIILSTK